MGDWRDERMAELERENAALRATVKQQAHQIDSLLRRVAVLEEQLRRSSTNSSKPPSSDGPKKQKRPHKPTGRKPGGQPGHPKHERPLAPPEKVTERVVVKPTSCEACDASLSGNDPQPHRHQVWEIPPVVPTITEYQLHALCCRGCGHVTRAELPEGVPTRWFGPRVEAVTALATGVYRVSKRTVVELLRDLFGLPMSVGAVVDSQHAMSRVLEVPFEEAHAYAKKQPVKHADETGWWEKSGRAWLWTVVTPLVSVFLVRRQRNQDVATSLLGSVQGILIADRHKAYLHWPARRYQFCWAHLKRDFVAMTERDPASKRIGQALLKEMHTMFGWWHRVRERTMSRNHFQMVMSEVQARMETLLTEGTQLGGKKSPGLCRALLARKQALWTFVRNEDVEPTNNHAERALRPAVLWRKGSFGTQSEEGSRFVERIMTVLLTCRQQNRNVLDFLVEARRAGLSGTPAPSLLPSRSLRR